MAEVIPWRYGVFKSGESTLESLMKALNRFDFAVLILTPDNWSRAGVTQAVLREIMSYLR